MSAVGGKRTLEPRTVRSAERQKRSFTERPKPTFSHAVRGGHDCLGIGGQGEFWPPAVKLTALKSLHALCS